MTAPGAVFRVDASVDIGSGHVMRCLTLANALAERGVRSTFLCRDLDGHLGSTIRASGHELKLLKRPTHPHNDGKTAHSAWLGVTGLMDAAEVRTHLADLSPSWLVVDHYALDADWLRALDWDKPVLAIDDLADRALEADIVLDQNLGRKPEDYAGRVAKRTRCLIGPKYALLRPEFAHERETSLARRHTRLDRVLVALGGVDKDNLTAATLEVLARFPFRVDVVLGPSAPHAEDVRKLADRIGAMFHLGTREMAQLMRDADLAIGGAGTSSWERCALGLPSLLYVLADNQRGAALALQSAGAAMVIASPDALSPAIDRVHNKERLRELSQKAARVTDGAGTQRVLEAML